MAWGFGLILAGGALLVATALLLAKVLLMVAWYAGAVGVPLGVALIATGLRVGRLWRRSTRKRQEQSAGQAGPKRD